ncbi:iron complex outermembrane recepter protein [Mitsuaria sp. PDC51]|uniref:TonB-dependent receptor plug domain-containing protein n=1 Tax=unclassified Roseateles TaxID=2626991 RepID=UPI0008E51F02|nr:MULTISPECIES: TonB-dependent receptor [unclassified Roseateles]MBB3284327.1 iron complex outermembrane receptor protein [Mitsuaria sp. BK037]SFR70217.1 iron complex outermembrane recepter protein [Mitsuaria sp. PDC51]
MSRQLTHRALALTSIAIASTLACGIAAAQESQQLERVEVTGSNIRRTAAEGTSPIDRITQAEIRASGAKTALELMKMVPAMGTDGFSDTPGQNSFSRGVATASLRGLGSTSTLVLLNGRRLTPAAYANPNNGTSTLYDLNSIPVSALERVEIFKDGASAVYGSDAVGGVINFITKNDYQGIQMGATVGANDDGEFSRQTVNGAFGFGDFAKDGFNLLISADITHRGRTMTRDVKDIHADDYRAINLRLNPYGSFSSASPFLTREGTPGQLNFPQGNPANVVIRTNCDPSQQITGGAVYGITQAPLLGRTFCNFNLDNYNEAQNKGTDGSLISRASFRVNNDITAFAEAGYARTERDYLGAPRTISGLSPSSNFLLGNVAPSFQPVLEIGHPDNPFSNARAAVQMRFENIRGGSELTNQQYRALGGVKGTTGAFDWESAVLWNKAKREETSFGFLNLDVLRTMLGPNGRTLAQIAADPNLSRPLTNNADASIWQWDAKVATEFGSLPGGAIGAAAGVEIRRETLAITPDTLNATGKILGLANTQIDGARTVKSAFVEFRTPWLKTFEMDFAGRADKYPGIKTNFVPKVGAKWTVIPQLSFRGTYSEGFRAPAVSQIAPGGAQYFVNGVIDPVRCEEDGSTPKPGAAIADCAKSVAGVGTSNPELKPEKSKSHSFGVIFSPNKNVDIVVDYFNIVKKGEVALLDVQSVVDHPERYPGLILRDTNPALQLPGVANSGPLLFVQTPWVNQGSTEVSGIDFEVKTNMIPKEGLRWTNQLRGTYMTRYSREEHVGDARNNLVGTNGGLADWATSAGDVPRLKFRATSTLDIDGRHSLMGAMNWVSGVSFIRRMDGAVPEYYSGNTCHWGGPNPDGVTGRTVLGVQATPTNGRDLYINRYPSCSTGKWMTFDVGYTYTGFKDLSLSLNIQNVTDEKAPYYPGTNTNANTILGWNPGLHNGYGRYWTFTANYTFK